MIYYCTDIYKAENNLKFIYELLPDFRKQKIDHLFLTKDKAQSGLVYLLLMYATAVNKIDINFKIDSYGKPYDANRNCFFSLSHCENSVACIIGNHNNGIDVEKIISQDDYEILKEHVCDHTELVFLNNSNKPLVEFTKLWTFKESYLKMIGTGIMGDLKKVGYKNCDVFFESKFYKNFILTYCSNSKENLIKISLHEIINLISNLRN